ncbi:putative reverse transcriptase domain-containing protein [Tanacetum coccineum]|uniref:Reverse transcriptase domain-containing protein n=1 Tax=Tanacetum coccineum TaxID=301880 RepID=A0ABQ5FA03_9ASTR
MMLTGESIEAVKIVEEANKRIQPTGTVELFGALRARLYDSNQNLIMATLTSISGLPSAMGPAIQKSSKGIVSDIVKCIGDNNKHMGECTLATFDSWVASTDLDKVQYITPSMNPSMTDAKLGADGRTDLFDGLSKQLAIQLRPKIGKSKRMDARTFQTLAAARMLTPTGPTGQTHWGDSMANNPMPAAHSVLTYLPYYKTQAELYLRYDMAAILYHSSPDLPNTSLGPSHKRRRSPMTYVPALPPVSGALSPVYVGLGVDVKDESSEQSRSRGTDIEVDEDVERSDGIDMDPVEAVIEACFNFANIIRASGVDVRVEGVTFARDDVETSMRDPNVVSDDVVTPPMEPGREQGNRIVGVESAVTALTERITELERDNRRLRGTASVESQRVNRLQRGISRMPRKLSKIPNTRSGASMTHKEIDGLVTRRVAEEMEAREVAMNKKVRMEGNGNGGNEGNGNGWNGGNGNGGNRENGNGNKNRNHGMNYGGTEGVDSTFTWWNTHKRKIGVDAAYSMKWAGLMRLKTEVYCRRNEIQKMETELWNLTVKGNDLTTYTQRFQGRLSRSGSYPGLFSSLQDRDRKPTKLQDAIHIANNLIDQKLKGYARSAKNKRRLENNPRDNRGQQPVFKQQNIGGHNVARAYTAGNNERKGYVGSLPYCNKCSLHHEGLCTVRCRNFEESEPWKPDKKQEWKQDSNQEVTKLQQGLTPLVEEEQPLIPTLSRARYSAIVAVAPPQKNQVLSLSTTFDDPFQISTNTSSASSQLVEVAPPKKLKEPTRWRTWKKSFTYSSSSSTTSRLVAPPQEKHVSTISTTPSKIPKPLYDLIQNAARARKSLKLKSNNRFAKRKLEHYEPRIPHLATFYRCFHQLPSNRKYDPETSFMAHVPKLPTPRPKPKPKTKKKKIKITSSSLNYHGRYPLNKDEQKVWIEFTVNDKTKENSCVRHPIQNLVMVEDDMVVDLLGKFTVDTFNKSCQMYVNRYEDNKVSGAEFMECKFYKLTKEYIFYKTIEAIEQGIPGVYTTKVECKTKDGARTLLNFELTDRKPKWNRPWVKPHLESKVEYETVEDGSSDPQDFYKLIGMVHRETEGGGFNYHNPPFSAHIIIYNSSKDKNAMAFEPNVSQWFNFW